MLKLKQILLCLLIWNFSLMKAADISNEARPFNVSKMWADALMQEYLSLFYY